MDDPEALHDTRPTPLEAYYARPLLDDLRSRIPWLVSMMLVQSVSAVVMEHYETILRDDMTLAFFVPMLVAIGGSAGNQPGVAVTRALNGGAATRDDWRRMLSREARGALATAVVLSAAAYLRVAAEASVSSAVVIALSAFVLVLLAACVGVLLSLGTSQVGVDPAHAAAPMVAAFADIMGLLVLFAFAASTRLGLKEVQERND